MGLACRVTCKYSAYYIFGAIFVGEISVYWISCNLDCSGQRKVGHVYVFICLLSIPHVQGNAYTYLLDFTLNYLISAFIPADFQLIANLHATSITITTSRPLE